MLAERRLDIMLRTAERANDALSLIQSDDVGPFKTSQDLGQIFVAVNAVESEQEWFDEWRACTQPQPGTPASDADVGRLTDKDRSLGGPLPMS